VPVKGDRNAVGFPKCEFLLHDVLLVDCPKALAGGAPAECGQLVSCGAASRTAKLTFASGFDEDGCLGSRFVVSFAGGQNGGVGGVLIEHDAESLRAALEARVHGCWARLEDAFSELVEVHGVSAESVVAGVGTFATSVGDDSATGTRHRLEPSRRSR